MYIKMCRSLNLKFDAFSHGKSSLGDHFCPCRLQGLPSTQHFKGFHFAKKKWTKSLKHHHLIPHNDAASVHINLLCGPGLDERQSVWFNLKIINPHEMQGMPSANQTWPFSNPPWNLFHGFGGSDLGTPFGRRCHPGRPASNHLRNGPVPRGPFSTGFSEKSETFTSSHLRHPTRVFHSSWNMWKHVETTNSG